MKAYHGNTKLKARFIKEIKKHEDADAIIAGTYGKCVDGKFKGCAVGCSIRSLSIINDKEYVTSQHSLYPELIGVPTVLAKLEDRIFEGLPQDLRKTWPCRFAEAINVGSDLSKVWPKFAEWLMIDPENGVIRYAKNDKTLKIIEDVANLYASGDYLNLDKCRKVRNAAAAAAADAYADAAAADAYAAAAADAYAADAYAYAAAAADAAAADAAAAAAAAAAADAAAADAYAAYAAYAAAAADAAAADAYADAAAADAYADAAAADAYAAAAADAAAADAAAADAAAAAAAAADAYAAYAAYAARQKAYVAQSEKLLQLISECK